MNGTLPGLLDDPNINSSLPILNDVHIPPLRNPAPSRHGHAPLPLELIDNGHLNDADRQTPAQPHLDDDTRARSTTSAPGDLISTKDRDNKKPHLAISELVGTPNESDAGHLQLPSFVSLSVVEKSPIQKGLDLNHDFPNKRPRLDADLDPSAHDVNRLLPRPIQKDDKHQRPMLPAMVTGLHEPPPSAALLPSMDLDARPDLQRSLASKMQLKDMLADTGGVIHGRPPEQMLNTPEITAAQLPRSMEIDMPAADAESATVSLSTSGINQLPKKDPKQRRARRKWTQAETDDLLMGVKKHGAGKWKQILNDPAFTFIDRTSIDLKDRFRVFAKDYSEPQPDVVHDEEIPADDVETGTDNSSNKPAASNPPKPTRRKRHPWTRDEDQALLQGVQQYGFQWTDIHNDPELKLAHRRATDLRDRIRNLYPDGYKHAEARPLRAEVKKAEKAGKKETPAGTLYAPPNQMDSITFSTPPRTGSVGAVASPRSVSRRQTTSGRVPSIAALTTNGDEASVTGRPAAPRRSKTVAETDHTAGVTLPSLAFDPANDTDDWDNTLPPFINWEA